MGHPAHVSMRACQERRRRSPSIRGSSECIINIPFKVIIYCFNNSLLNFMDDVGPYIPMYDIHIKIGMAVTFFN